MHDFSRRSQFGADRRRQGRSWGTGCKGRRDSDRRSSQHAGHGALIEEAQTALGAIDLVVVSHGTLSDQAAGTRDVDLALNELTANFLSHASILTHAANVLDAQGHGTIVVLGSVAGIVGGAPITSTAARKQASGYLRRGCGIGWRCAASP